MTRKLIVQSVYEAEALTGLATCRKALELGQSLCLPAGCGCRQLPASLQVFQVRAGYAKLLPRHLQSRSRAARGRRMSERVQLPMQLNAEVAHDSIVVSRHAARLGHHVLKTGH